MIRPAISLTMQAAKIAALLSLAGTAWAFAPHVVDAVRIVLANGGTAEALERAAAASTPEELLRRAEQALADDDAELAESLSRIAADRDDPFPAELAEKIDAAGKFSFKRSALEIWKGATTGRADTVTAFAASVAADAVVGDARDLATEIAKYPDQDNFTLFIAATGLAMTADTFLTTGAALPLKGGVSLLKTARKLGKIPKSLEEDMVRLGRRSIDGEALAGLRRPVGSLDVAGLARDGRRLIRPDAIKTVGEAAGAVYSVSAKQGYRAAMQTIENAGDIGDLQKLGAAAEKLGPKYRGTLALRDGAKLTVRLATRLLEVIWTLLGAAIWVICAAWAFLSLFLKVSRLPFKLARRTTTRDARSSRHTSLIRVPSTRIFPPTVEVIDHGQKPL